MKNKDECLNCPVRGACCYLSIDLEGYNVILDRQPCEFLDTKTGLCTMYEDRVNIPHCRTGEKVFTCGGLPEGCLLLKNKDQKNKEYLKVYVKKIAHELSPEGLLKYNFLNNHPTLWEIYKKECV